MASLMASMACLRMRSEVIMDSALTRVIESSQRVAQGHCKESLGFGPEIASGSVTIAIENGSKSQLIYRFSKC